MTINSIHPVTRLLFWLGWIVLAQCLNGVFALMAVVLALFSLPAMLGLGVLRRALRLIWRARWLLLTLLIVFSWAGVGEPVWAAWGAPSWEGVEEGLIHVARIVLTLLIVAALLESISTASLLAAIYMLLAPLRWRGVDCERGMVRLMLVLRQLESPPSGDWRALLRSDAITASVSDEFFELEAWPLQRTDWVLLLLGLLFFLMIFWCF